MRPRRRCSAFPVRGDRYGWHGGGSFSRGWGSCWATVGRSRAAPDCRKLDGGASKRDTLVMSLGCTSACGGPVISVPPAAH